MSVKRMLVSEVEYTLADLTTDPAITLHSVVTIVGIGFLELGEEVG